MTASRAIVASVIGCVALGCGVGTREHEEEVHRTVSDDQRCPSADALAQEEQADSAELLREERIVLTPLCWYRIEVFGSYDRCSTTNRPSAMTLAKVRASNSDAFAPSDSGTKDSRLGSVLCIDGGPVLLLQAGSATCPAGVTADETWGTLGDEGRVANWWAAGFEPRELLASDERAARRLCAYETVTERSARGCSNSGGSLGGL